MLAANRKMIPPAARRFPPGGRGSARNLSAAVLGAVLCAGLLLFGYPLHPPKRPEKLRHEHFAAIVQPALFLQGTRDTLCDLELLRQALQTYGGSALVEEIEGADHGFHVPKSSGRTDEDVLEGLIESAEQWAQQTFSLSPNE